jgi:hypothetical protein
MVNKYKHLKMTALRETFEIYYAVALKFTLTQTNCRIQKDEKHNL